MLSKLIRMKENARIVAESNLYDFSDPAPTEMMERLNPLFSKMGIKTLDIRTFPGMSAAITTKNTILINSMSNGGYEGVAAHEAGHVVFGDIGNTYKKQEYRADRFAKYITGGKMDGFIETISENSKLLNEETGMFRSMGTMGKIAMHFRDRDRVKRYGTLEERLANLEKPLSKEEIAHFEDAIAKYNERVSAPLAQQQLPENNALSAAWENAKQSVSKWFGDSSARNLAVSNAKEVLASGKVAGLGAFGAAVAAESARQDIVKGEYTEAAAKVAGAVAGGVCFAGAAVEAAPLLLVPVVGGVAYGAAVLGASGACAYAGHGLVSEGKLVVEEAKNIGSPPPTNSTNMKDPKASR